MSSKTIEKVETIRLDHAAMRLLMAEEARYMVLPGYAAVPSSETENGNRYTVAVRDIDNEQCFVLTIDINAIAKDMAHDTWDRTKSKADHDAWLAVKSHTVTHVLPVRGNWDMRLVRSL